MEANVFTNSKCLTLGDIAVTTVKPIPKEGHRRFEKIHPTSIDVLLKAMFCPYLFAYRTAGKEDGSGDPLELIRRMRSSLQQVLDVFYPFAGRWVSSSAEGDSQLHLQCNDAGVPFVEAYANEDLNDVLPIGTGDGVSLTTLQVPRVSALFEKGFEALGVRFTDWDGVLPEGGLPPLVVQVTRFKCGGVVLVTTYSHMLVDASSFFHFIKAWSDFALTGQTSITPDFDREKVQRILPKRDGPKNWTGQKRPEGTVQFPKRVFEVRKSVVDAMKLEVEKETNNTKYVSTVDCICAHIWKSISKDELKTFGRERVYGLGVVEGRTKFFDPPLSKYWFGNMMQPTLYPDLSAQELNAMPTSTVALMIREGRESITQPTWFSPERVTPIWELIQSENKEMWSNISFTGFPIYNVNFGGGNPIFACPATAQWFQPHKLGRVVIYPSIPSHPKSSSSLHFEINPQLLDTFCIDKEFLSFFLDT